MKESFTSYLLRRNEMKPDHSSLYFISGFTLIELLIVISVIAVLVGMLLPALNRTRQTARNIKCESNIKQMGYVVILYVGDFLGKCMPHQQYTLTEKGTNNFLGRDLPFYYKMIPVTGKNDTELRRLKRTFVACPETETKSPEYTPSYGFNTLYTGVSVRNGPPKRIFSRIKEPTKMAVAGENVWHYSNISYGKDANYSIRFRHNKKTNVCFADGHVETREMYRVPSKEVPVYSGTSSQVLEQTRFWTDLQSAPGTASFLADMGL